MISVQDLTHYYGDRRAIEGISFEIGRNEIVGFLGLNGAGKSTTLKILAGLIVPSAGSVAIDGVDLISAGADFRSSIGYLPEDPPLYREMTVESFVRFCGQLKGMSAADVNSRIDGILALTQLTHMRHRVISELSHGYRKRVGIAQAIIHQPKLVILDEPISGLDPRQIVEMRQVIRGLAKDCTVLISSHILGEISETCDRLLVLANGKIVAHGTEQDVVSRGERQAQTGARLTMVVRGEKAKIEATLKALPSMINFTMKPEGELWRLNAALQSPDGEGLVVALVQAGVGIRRVSDDETELEQAFLGLTKGAIS